MCVYLKGSRRGSIPLCVYIKGGSRRGSIPLCQYVQGGLGEVQSLYVCMFRGV